MKIRQLVFSNINSLRGGPHIINFDEEPLASAGIFAIVGPTGSGKSTILDVITLALFNKTPRFQTISDRRIEKEGSIITHFAKSADAAIEYEVNGQRYTSFWSIHIASSGRVQPYHMEIQDAAGNIIAERSAVPAKNEELIGLNYDQFVRSIILSQGDFAKFLKAKKEERSELLEKLTGSDIYRKLSIATYYKSDGLKKDLKLQKSLLDEIKLLTEEEINQIQSDIGTIEKENQQLTNTLKERNKVRVVKESSKLLQEKIKAKTHNLSQLTLEIDQFSQDAERLKMHEKVSDHAAEIRQYRITNRNFQNTEIELGRLKKNLEVAKNGLSKSIKAMSELTGKSINTHNFRSEMSALESAVSEFDHQLVTLHQRGIEQRERVKQTIDRSQSSFKSDTKSDDAIHQLTSEIRNLKSLHGIHEPIDAQKNELNVAKSNLSVLQVVKVLQESREELQKEIGKETRNVVEFNKVLEEQQPKIDNAHKILVLQEKNLELLRKQKEDAVKIASLETLRLDLEEGKPCPLCGSISHPFSKHLQQEEQLEIDQLINKTEREIAVQEAALKVLEKLTERSTIGLNMAQDQIERAKLKIKEIDQKITNEKVNYNGKNEIHEDNLDRQISKLSSNIKALEEQISFSERLLIARELLAIFSTLKEIGVEYNRIKSARMSLYTGSNVKKECNDIQDSFTKFKTELEKTEDYIREKTSNLATFAIDLKEIKSKLTQKIQELGIESIDEMEAYLLDEATRTKLLNRQTQLTNSRIKFQAEIEQHQAEFKDLSEKDLFRDKALSKIITEIQEIEIKRDQNASKVGELRSMVKFDKEKRKSHTELALKIKKLEKDYEKWSLLNEMIGSANGSKFANFAQELTLRKLIQLANVRLSSLTDRYKLYLPHDGGTLGVIDDYQGQSERSVNTMSGGEIFILSLALALSLSDMASQNISLESLFIDEGFGTLDHETLDVAISTLEKLQSENKKMVGIISHVEALKERIYVQIQLNKNANGFSTIEVTS